ncbi:hypothetical protein [Methanobrevibacter sp.]|uniref:hypothetical protein n=1 Tax=Methanobrevibacter sp. TaxID=66852 RepID=UPI0025F82AB1|nr:hypothetical protein [Methanobrevibacter sp.]MBQ6512174.1 hypothetical protein [Methanobrevibacter sp.]
MLDEKGNLFVIEAIFAIILLLFLFLIFNYTVSIPNPTYSGEIKNSKTAQDTMEILSGKINFTDRTFIGDISEILKENDNSKESVDKVSKLCKDKLKSLNLKNYRFSETNVLDDEPLASKGDISKAKNVSVAMRTYGDYSYTLSVW